ncbi:MAG: hypothetical protein V2A76_10585 [Planctomycetota bacterium]
MILPRSILAGCLLSFLLLPACTSGRGFDDGLVRRENVNVVLGDFGRDEGRVQYALIQEPVLSAGSTWAGNQYVNMLDGAALTVNVPGAAMAVFYPFHYADLTEAGAHPFGIGSGDGDLRVSLLWGFLSLGRNWNVLWMRGFWLGRSDPMFSTPPDQVVEEFETSLARGDLGPASPPV